MNRYIRQIALPEIGLNGQERLEEARIVMVGAGGLGSAALPYLAAAGIGNITIIDHDTVDLHNLHRQTIFRMDQIGINKAICAKNYLEALNPEITCCAITEKLTNENAHTHITENFTLILDGSDNFTTKSLLNDLSVSTQTPLLTASVNLFHGQIGIFAGFEADKPCYRCLFPDFPTDARNCNEAGILGTSAGIIGMMQAHIAILHLLDPLKSPDFISVNLKTMRNESVKLHKENSCLHCNHTQKTKHNKMELSMPELININALNDTDTIIIDVRQPEEITADPLRNPLIQTAPVNIPLPELIARLDELPTDKRLAFLCAGNIRSRQAAEYLSARGYENICILDKFTV